MPRPPRRHPPRSGVLVPAGPQGSGGSLLSDVRGGLDLAVQGTQHVTSLVQAMHGTILQFAPPLRAGSSARLPADHPATSGITGLVYRSIQQGTRLVGDGLQGLLKPWDATYGHLLPPSQGPRRDAVVAALNGVLGDHLLASGNPLAIPFALRQGGRAIDPQALAGDASPHLLLMVHGLCMSDTGWRRNGHDHGQVLGQALGHSVVYAFYNSGLHISDNGRHLARALDELLRAWPVPVQSLAIVGHSMGGLVARSACAVADSEGLAWRNSLRKLVFLGTPHHGAPLERAGNWLHRVMDLSPYVAPFTRLSRLRSLGITDLRHGHVQEADWRGPSRFDHRDHRQPLPLPAGVECFALASTLGDAQHARSLLGDGLVPVESALGHHRKKALDLGLPADHCWVGRGIGHLDLLCDPLVYRRLLACLG
jgi:hypothetical protein